MARLTKADLEERIVERDLDVDRLEFELDDWRRTAGEKDRLLERADDEISFLRSIVHGLIPSSLTAPGGPR